MERREWVPVSIVCHQLEEWLEQGRPVDFITFSGSGEPTMHSRLGELIDWIKQRTSIPVAVITNSAHLHDAEVRADLRSADVVLPSLDTVDEAVFQKLNRPAPGLTVEMILEGLRALRREYTGQIWLEVMLCRGINDSQPQLRRLAIYLNELRPDRIQINTPVRPGAEAIAQPCTEEQLEQARLIFGPRAEIIASVPLAASAPAHHSRPADGMAEGGAVQMDADLGSRVIGHLRRRPATIEDLAVSLQADAGHVQRIVDDLIAAGSARHEERDGRSFVVMIHQPPAGGRWTN
ncbi:MAG: radical SAM protein [Candidatus Sumerlaeia bacterium]